MENGNKHFIAAAVVILILFSGGTLLADEAVDPGDYSAGDLITALSINTRFQNLYNTVNGLIANDNLKSDAASLFKVSGGAMTSSGGDIGIGTPTPGTMLEVNGVITAAGGTSTSWNTAYSDRLKWDGGATGLTAATGRTSLGIRGFNSAYSSDNAVYINSGGNVGIGTPSPGTTLEVNGVITAAGGTSTNWNTAYSDRLKWDGGATGLTAATGRTSLGIRGFNSGYSSDDAVYIDSSGEVGIGTTNPTSKLHVEGDLNVTGDIYQNGAPLLPIGTILMYDGTGIADVATRTEDIGDRAGDTITLQGWKVCNGYEGTPDLLNKFIRAQSTSGSTGGTDSGDHTHSTNYQLGTIQLDHTHIWGWMETYDFWTHWSTGGNREMFAGSDGFGAEGSGYGLAGDNTGDWTGYTNLKLSDYNASHKHSTDSQSGGTDNKPAYYSLIFIKKMS